MLELLALLGEGLGDWTRHGGLGRMMAMLMLCAWAVIALFNGSVIASLVVFAIDFGVLLWDLKVRRAAQEEQRAM